MLKQIAPGILIAFLLSSCAPQPAQTTVDLGEEFTLATGQSTTINSQQLDIRFLEIIGDSRCPTGATCVWQGEVSAQVEITFRGAQFTKVLTQPGLTSERSTADFNEYEIAFSVLPYPELGKEIPKNDYRLQLTVDKNPPLSGGLLATFDFLGEKHTSSSPTRRR